MGHGFESQEATGAEGDNPNKNSSSSTPCPQAVEMAVATGRAKTSRKKSRVTRSQINDFHANANPNEEEKEEEEEEEEEQGGRVVGGKSRSKAKNKNINRNGNRNRYHVCKHCNRAFSSGRALGGHIRIHGASFNGGGGGRADSSNNSSSKSLFKPPEVDGSEDSDSDSSASSRGLRNGCSPKMVSLYTLRNNPKRSSIIMDPEFSLELLAAGAAAAAVSVSGAKRSSCWQESNSGILPPYSSESGSDLGRTLLPKWSVTRSRTTRGGAALGSRRRGGPRDVGADDRDTAHLLVMLAGKTRSNNNEERESTEESVYDSKPPLVSNLESQGSIEDLGGSGGEESRIVQKKRRKRKKSAKNEYNDYNGEAGNFSKEVLESDVDTGKYAQQQQLHQCNTCKKVFNSHQALGGHRASHRKVKGCFAADGDGDGDGEEEEEEEGEVSLMETKVEAEPEKGGHMLNFEEEGAVTMSHLTQEESPEQESFSQKVGKAQAHQCSICHKVFASGQALGGHKRCHWIGDRITETTTSVISTEKHQQQLQLQHLQQQDSVYGQGRSVREELLDLNQPPPMDEDDIRAAFGFDSVPTCAESVNQRVKMLGGGGGAGVASNAVDSFKSTK